MADKWTARDIPRQDGRVAVVTGANSGLGFETARELAGHGATVVLAVRDLDKGKAAADRITAGTPEGVSRGALDVRHLDLASLESVRAAAAGIRATHPKIDLLVNNAGVMYTPRREETEDGFERQLGTNHLGHFALTGLLLDALLPGPDARIVTVSSVHHRMLADIHFDDLQSERSYSRVGAYARSKLANLMFTYELQRRLAAARVPVISVAAHPGGADTDLTRDFPAVLRVLWPILPVVTQSAEMGALPLLRAATDPTVRGGQCYGPDRPFQTSGHPVAVASSRKSHDAGVQRRLWSVSEELTGVTFPV